MNIQSSAHKSSFISLLSEALVPSPPPPPSEHLARVYTYGELCVKPIDHQREKLLPMKPFVVPTFPIPEGGRKKRFFTNIGREQEQTQLCSKNVHYYDEIT